MTTLVIYIVSLAGLMFSIAKDKGKTIEALRLALRSLVGLLPSAISVAALVGIIVGLIPSEVISRYLGSGSGWKGTLLAAVVGAVTLIPSLVSLPLAASILRAGATVMTVAAFITTLTMVGFVTAPLETRELGKRFTFFRNTLGFLFALIIAFLMGVVLT